MQFPKCYKFSHFQIVDHNFYNEKDYNQNYFTLFFIDIGTGLISALA